MNAKSMLVLSATMLAPAAALAASNAPKVGVAPAIHESSIQQLASLNLQSVLLILAFTLLSGLGDGAGFVYASRIWSEGRFVWVEAVKCIAAFQFGMVMYWLALWKLTEHGVESAELQTMFWFVVTIIGVALLSGRVFAWAPLDQAVAGAVLMGVFFLMYRGASA